MLMPFFVPEYKDTFAKSCHLYVPKNCTFGARTKIMRPLLSAKHPLKIAELPLILSATTFEWGFSQFGNSVLFQPFSRLARTPKQCADRGNGKKLG